MSTLPAALIASACGGPEAINDEVEPPPETEIDEKDPFASRDATLLDFEFDGELIVGYTYSVEQIIQDQMLYSIGHLNGDRSVARLDRLALSNIQNTRESDGSRRIKYHAKIPVAWGSKTNLPTSYKLRLPKKMDYEAQVAFTTKYHERCEDYSAHDVDAGSYWYYYRPNRSGCSIDAADVTESSARVTVSAQNTTGKYPEYDKIWEDGELIVVSIFGKYEDGATTDSDAGVAAYNRFISLIRSELGSGVVTVPAQIPSNPGVGTPKIELRLTRADGRKVTVHAILVDNVRTAGAEFDSTYEALSTEADLIAYNGHAGLGANVRALARKGHFRAGKYQIFFMNGCDTFAYVDGALAETRARLNPEDPTGTKFMEIVTNAMPSYFSSNASNDIALIRALSSIAAPKTYLDMFAGIDRQQVVVVTGEEDNVFQPGGGGGGGGGGGAWAGLEEKAAAGAGVEKRYQTPTLPAGSVVLVEIDHDPTSPGGDADLYVKAGSAPTTTSYDCRPYEGGSTETCRVTLRSSGVVHIMVRGYSQGTNAFVLRAKLEGGGGGGGTWNGMDQAGTVTRGQEVPFETPELAAGRYRFEMTGTGDADLYVRVGGPPTTTAYDCRPYRSDSNELCQVTLSAPAKIHLMVSGYAASSSFRVIGRAE